jgi:hypothetical protein
VDDMSVPVQTHSGVRSRHPMSQQTLAVPYPASQVSMSTFPGAEDFGYVEGSAN